jgi:glycosyltransferase involved in cell wall biosynthesis
MKSIQFVHEIPINEVKANLIQTLNMCRAFADRGVRVKLLILVQIPKKKSEEIVNGIIPGYKKKFEVEFIDYKPTLSFFSSLDRFMSLRKHIDYSFEYIFTRSPLVTIYSINKIASLIYEAHNSYYTKQKYLDKIYRWKFKQIIKKESFKMFLSISDNLKNYWSKNGILHSKSVALHDGTSNDFQVIKPPNIGWLKEDCEKLKILYTGSLYEDRGINRLLNLAEDFPEINFLVIGGPNRNADAYREEAKDKGIRNIIFVGQVEHKYISYYLSKADILLALWSKSVPTIEYCSPLKVFEYLSANKLIIADGFTTIKEVLKHNENAILCEPDDYRSLKQSLQNVVDNPSLLELGNMNSKLIEKKYSWEKRVESIINRLNDTV